MEARLAEQLKAITEKMASFDGLREHLDELDHRVSQRLDQVQTKMDLLLVSLGQVQQDQAQVGKALQDATEAAAPGPARLGGSGMLGMPRDGLIHQPGGAQQPGARLETAKASATTTTST